VSTIEVEHESERCGHTMLPFPSSEGIIPPCWFEERRRH
jgi:hypothetical protein